MQFLDSLSINWFVLVTSVVTAIILYLILFKIPDEDDQPDLAESDDKSRR